MGDGRKTNGKRQNCLRASGRAVRNVFTVELSGEPPRCTSELSQPQQRRLRVEVLCALLVTGLWSQITETDSAGGREKRKHACRLSAVFIFFLMLACISVLSFISLWSFLPNRITCYSLAVFGSRWYEGGGFGASPNNSLSDRPLPALYSSLSPTPSTLLWWGFEISCDLLHVFEVWLLGWMNTGHFSQSEHVMCFYRMFTLSRTDSAAPLLLWKYRCCKSWQESPSLTRSDQVVMEISRLFWKWGKDGACTHIFL